MEMVKFRMSDIVVSLEEATSKMWRIIECLEDNKYKCMRFVKGKRKTKVFDVGELRKVKNNRFLNVGDKVLRKSDLKVLTFLYQYDGESIICEYPDKEKQEWIEVNVKVWDWV